MSEQHKILFTEKSALMLVHYSIITNIDQIPLQLIK